LGVTYKPDIDDVRESPALDVIQLLLEKGARVSYHDPFVPTLDQEGMDLVSEDLEPALAAADCVVVIANHSSYDWSQIAQQATLIVDTRHALKGITGPARIVGL
jgi:UDP-N-acetyl-D-glucosamine dehydrogenase